MDPLKNENLLSLLVKETFDLSEVPIQMVSYKLEYQKAFHCYQVLLGDKTYTFPVNWGPFSEVYKREGDGLIVEKDLECLNSIFSNLLKEDIKTSFVYSGEDTYIIFIPAELEISLSDLQLLIDDHTNFKIAA